MRIKYRPEIDGLRAIAVLAVIFYHAEFLFFGVDIFKGGFVGVDVFFVISGYLITSIILADLRDGKFSFLKFYERRTRRLLPALFTVMVASIPFAWLYLLPKSIKEYSGSIISSLLFSSNFWFWSEDSYWAEPSALKPFLHTWSLSVEEQFYLIFPTILLLLWKFIPKRIIGVLSLLFLVSLQFADYYSSYAPEFTFFLLPARGWELLAGAILAKYELNYGRSNQRFLGKVAPALGIILIIYAVVFFNKDTKHPSYLTLIPVVGTMLVIWFAKNGEVVTNFLQKKIIVGMGLISYSLYLWHYPIFAFARINKSQISQIDKLECLVLSIILSVLTYFLIEQPARYKIKSKTLFTILPIVALLILSFNVAVIVTKGSVWRYENWQLRFVGEDRAVGKRYLSIRFNQFANGDHFTSSPKRKLLIIGDSYAQDIYNVLHESNLLTDLEVSAHFISARCKNIPNSELQPLKHIKQVDQQKCKDAIRVGDKSLDKMITSADGIILASSWDELTVQYLDELQEELLAKGADNVLIVSKKQFPTISNQKLVELTFPKIINLKRPSDERAFNIYQSIKKKSLKGVLDIHALVCGDTNFCPVSTPNGYLLSFDGSHLTQEGAQYVGEKIIKDTQFMIFWNSLRPS